MVVKRKILEQLVNLLFVLCVLLILLFLFNSIVGCTPKHIPASRTDCEKACNRLLELSCPGYEGSVGPDEVTGTADDVACADVCFILSKDFNLHPVCVQQVQNCKEVDLCFD